MDFNNLITFNLDFRGRYARSKTFHNTKPKFNKNIKKITNDIWDKKFDRKITRTQKRPLAIGIIKTSECRYVKFPLRNGT